MLNRSDTNLFIVGAGFAGQMIAQDIARKKIFGKVSAFLDDDKDLIGKKIDGIPVLGPIDDIAPIAAQNAMSEAIIAMPSAPGERIREIYELLKRSGILHIRILPAISQVVSGTAHLVQIRDVNMLDILGRTPIILPLGESLKYLRGKRVMITGAGGSIGSELARQLLSGGAERLYLFGHGENSIVNIYRELHVLQTEGVGEKAQVVPIIGDIKDRSYMRYIMAKTRCDAVFHCAAYKHVPMMEDNPVAVIENNVFGTKNLLDACLENGVKKFVLISTDKAVAPVSTYGVSKMLCEKLLLDAAKKAKNGQSYMFVRFGNVLGSRGSLLPIFMEQLKAGQPLTVTHPDMERYFMTIPEACSLVLEAGGVGENGKSYLLDMGEPIKIIDIAKQVIRFAGFEPYRDVDIKIVGLREGERLFEPLWLKEEEPKPTKWEKILELKNIEPTTFKLDELLKELAPICLGFEQEEGTIDIEKYRNKALLNEILCRSVPTLAQFQEEIKAHKDEINADNK